MITFLETKSEEKLEIVNKKYKKVKRKLRKFMLEEENSTNLAESISKIIEDSETSRKRKIESIKDVIGPALQPIS